MGLSEQWVAIRVPTQKRDVLDAIAVTGLDLVGEREGWFWARGWTDEATDSLVKMLAGRVGEPCIGGWVFDSDFGCIGAAGPDNRPPCIVAVKAPYDNGSESARFLARQWHSPRRRNQSARELAQWSATYAPAAIAADDVRRALADDDDTALPGSGPVFAEDAIRKIFKDMGFPSLDEIVFCA